MTAQRAKGEPIVDGEFWHLEEYDRDLECEHRDALDDGALDPCDLEAEFAV